MTLLKPPRQGNLDHAMPLHLERIEWMPSPPLVPDDGPIDFAHLNRMTLGDADLEREVLALFSAQSTHLVDAIGALPEDARALARASSTAEAASAINAFAIADAPTALEEALASGSDPSQRLAALREAVSLARTAIGAILRRC